MIFSKFWMFKDLEELQINDCQTDICLVGAGGVKVFIHRTMLTSTLKTLGSLPSTCASPCPPWGT